MNIAGKIASEELEKAIASIRKARSEVASKNYKASRPLLDEAINHLNKGLFLSELAHDEEELRHPDTAFEAEGWSLFIDPDEIKKGEPYLLTTTGASISYRVAYYEDGEWRDWNTYEALGLDEDETLYFKEI